MASVRADSEELERGASAERPTEIPAKGWREIFARVRRRLGRHNVSLLAAGVGLFALLAAFPALTAMVAIYGLFASPSDIAAQLEIFEGVMPADALEIFRSQLTSIAQQRNETLGIGLLLSVVIALWGARKGIVAIMQACNVAYGEDEERSMLRMIVVSLALTLAAIVYFLALLCVAVALPVAFQVLIGNDVVTNLVSLLRWPVMWLLVVLGLAVVYRYAPSRRSAQWRWLTWGSGVAATLWVVGSIAFAIYVRSFANYGATYGALGGVVVLLLWLYLSGYFVILGAEINAAIEHQTAKDSTIGPERPLGQRGAYVADTRP